MELAEDRGIGSDSLDKGQGTRGTRNKFKLKARELERGR